MKKITVLLIGLEQKEATLLRQHLGFEHIFLHHEMLPNLQLVEGRLMVESQSVMDKFLEVDKVIFHGIFEDDFDVLTLLSLWNGPCLPNPLGMMNLRQRIPGLARALQVTRFGNIKRGMAIGSRVWQSDKEVVAKWGIWHCGEDKHKFKGAWKSLETAVIEEFIEGEAVRIMKVGSQHWQIKLAGDSWLKSIHHASACEMTIDATLLEDTEKLAAHFDIPIIGVDYMVGNNGEKYLLEVNHIPNVTVFPFVNEAFAEYCMEWLK